MSINRMTGNWWFPWDVFLVPQGNGDLLYYAPTLIGERYTWNVVTSSYSSPPGAFDTMVQNGDGTWTKTERDGRKWHFNTGGYLDWVRNRYGLQVTINRDATQKITSIVDSVGRTTTLAYNAAGYLASTTDSIGRSSTFTYDANGYLTSITGPSTTYYDRSTSSVVTGSKTVTLQNITGTSTNLDGNVTTVTDDAGQTIRSLAYDTSDRVTTYTFRGGNWTFAYGAATRVTDPDGIVTDYSFDANSLVIRKEVFTSSGLGGSALRTGEPSSYVWLYTRSTGCGCGLISRIVRPDGSSVDVTYDSWGNRTSRQANCAPGVGAPSRLETWTWSSFATYSRLTSYIGARGNAAGATAADYKATYTYDSSGSLLTTTLPKTLVGGTTLTAATITDTRGSVGQLLTRTYANGMVEKFEYDAATYELTKVTDDYGGLNIVTQMAYDSVGRNTSYTNAAGDTMTFTYNALDQLVEVQGPTTAGPRVKYLYDSNGSLYQSEFENLDHTGAQVSANPWFTTTYDYDNENRLTDVTSEVDASTTATTSYTYTSGGRLETATDPTGRDVEYEYDERGLVFKVTEAPGTAVAGTTTYDYSLTADLVTLTDPLGNQTTFDSDHEGWQTSRTDALGTTITIEYLLDGQVAEIETRDSSAVLLNRTTHTYDPVGHRTSTTAHEVDASGSVVASHATSYVRNAALQLVSVTNPLSATTSYTYDALGRLSRADDATSNFVEYEYDAMSRPDLVRLATWNSVTSTHDVLLREHAYDVFGNQVTATARDTGSTMSVSSSAVHDSRGLVSEATDPLGNTMRFEYDARGLTTDVHRDLRAGGTGAGAVTSTMTTQTEYDLAGRVTKRLDGLNNATTYAYDDRGRPLSVTDPATATTTLAYDAAGNVTSATDALGTIVSSTYDVLHRVTARTITRATGVLGTTSEAYSYDSRGALVLATDNDSTVSRVVDCFGRVTSETQGPNPLGGAGRTFSYGYNAVGGLTQVTYPDGTVELRTRDAGQRVTGIAVQGGPTLGGFSYSGGRVVQESLQSGVTVARTYDALQRNTWVTATNPSVTLTQFEYLLDAVGNRLFEKRHHSTGVGDNYTLDSLYRTVSVTEGVADPAAEYTTPGSQTYTQTQASTYDLGQNRSLLAVTPMGGATTNTAYTADSTNFYTAVGGTTHVRDARGNTTDDGTRLFAYDYRGQLVEIRDKPTNALIASYTYDVLSRRIGKSVVGGSAESHYWLGGTLAMKYDGSGFLGRRHLGPKLDQVVAAERRDLADLDGDSSTTDLVWLTPLYDGAFDCVALLDPTGAIAERYVHDFDGTVTITDAGGVPQAASPAGWTQGYGRGERDDESGFVLFRSRYYVPQTGRFLTQDRSGVWFDAAAAGNPDAYVGNSYRNDWDPSGKSGKDKDGGKGDKKGKKKGTTTKPVVKRAGTSSLSSGECCEGEKKKVVIIVPQTTFVSAGGWGDDLLSMATSLVPVGSAAFIGKSAEVMGYEVTQVTWKAGDTDGALSNFENVTLPLLKTDPCFTALIVLGHGSPGKFVVDGRHVGPDWLNGLDHPLEVLAFLTCSTCDQTRQPDGGSGWEPYVSPNGLLTGNEGDSAGVENGEVMGHALGGLNANK